MPEEPPFQPERFMSHRELCHIVGQRVERGVAAAPFTLFMTVGLVGWWVIQHALTPRLVGGVNTETWRALYAVQSTHPDYWWTFVTALFSHLSLRHLGMNLLAFLVVGPILEQEYRSRHIALLFMGTGIFTIVGATLGAILMGVDATMMGASGAIYGLTTVFFLRLGRLGRSGGVVRVPFSLVPVLFAAISVQRLLTGGYLTGGVVPVGHLLGVVGGVVGWYALGPRTLSEKRDTS